MPGISFPFNFIGVPVSTTSAKAVTSLLDNLVAYWHLEEASGTRSDVSGNALHLSDNSSVGSAVGVAGAGTAANFTGANWLSHANDAILQAGPNKDFTISVWFRPVGVTATQSLVSRWEAGNEYALFVYTKNIDFTVAAPGAVPNSFANSMVVPGAWYHALAWVDHTAGKSWIRINNGTAKSSNIGAIAAQNIDFKLGQFSGAQYFTGRMAQLGIWNRILTATEQTALWAWGGGLPYPFGTSGSISGLVNLVFEGDSLTIGNVPAPSTPYPDQTVIARYADPGASCVYQNRGVAGRLVGPHMIDDGVNCDARYNSQYSKNICILWGGSNDLDATRTAAATWADIKTFCAARKAKGFRTIVLTVTPRTDAGWVAGKEAQRVLLNASIVGGDASIDAVADVAGLANLADPNNLTYYQDKIHLTTAGYGEVAGLVSTTIGTL